MHKTHYKLVVWCFWSVYTLKYVAQFLHLQKKGKDLSTPLCSGPKESIVDS